MRLLGRTSIAVPQFLQVLHGGAALALFPVEISSSACGRIVVEGVEGRVEAPIGALEEAGGLGLADQRGEVRLADGARRAKEIRTMLR